MEDPQTIAALLHEIRDLLVKMDEKGDAYRAEGLALSKEANARAAEFMEDSRRRQEAFARGAWRRIILSIVVAAAIVAMSTFLF